MNDAANLLFASLQKNLENFQNEIHSKCRAANEKDGVGDGSRHEFKQTVNKNLQTIEIAEEISYGKVLLLYKQIQFHWIEMLR